MALPLSHITVLEFAGLAPGPFAGKLLADFGAKVLRIDRHDAAVSTDALGGGKRSIRVNLKSSSGVALVRRLASTADVIIDPFRPGVLERLGLGPDGLRGANPRLIYARMAGFRGDGKYKDMAGHDINYIAVSGALSLLGREGEKPYAPGNLLADFAGGGMMCAVGILLALFGREQTGKGQVVEANMVDGSAHISAWPRLLYNAGVPLWNRPRGTNMLDGGSPFYDTYETKDGKFMAVGCLEPKFYDIFAKLLVGEEEAKKWPDRGDRANWPALRDIYTRKFKEKTRKEWENIYDGTDACVTPVKDLEDMKADQFERRPPVRLVGTPAKTSKDWRIGMLMPGQAGKEALEEWFGLKEGEAWTKGKEGHALVDKPSSKL